MGPVVVYEAEIKWARQALTALRAAGIPAELLDLPPPVMQGKVPASLSVVKVAVSKNDVGAAREVLQRWAAEGEREAAPLSRSILLSLLVVAGPPIVAGAVISLLHVQGPDWLFWAGVGWVVLSIAAIGLRQKRTLKGHK